MMVSPPGDLKMRSLGAPGSRSREGACGRVHARLVRLLLSAVTVALTLSAYAFPRVKGVRLSAEGCAQDESLKQCETVDEVRVQLRWIRSAQFAGFYAAEAKQYYADECIHVTLVPRAKHSTVTPEEPVLLGLQDFGTPFMASNLMNAESGNGRLVTLAQVFRRPGLINVINPWTQPNISSFEDLAGRKTTIASSPDDVKLLVFASALNLTLCGPVFDIPCDGSEDIRVIFKSLGATSNLMLDPSDENFAEVASFTIYNQYNGLLRMKKDDGSLFQPDEIRFLEDPKQFQGLQFMEDGIGVNAPWLDLEGSTDLAKRFLRATLKGWIHCRDNPTSCVNIMLQDDEDHQTHITFMLKEINKMIWPSPDGIGNINEKEHNDVYRAMFEFSAVSRLYSADDFTNGSIIASVLSELIKEGYDVHGWHYEYGDLRTQLTYCLDRSDRVVLCEGTLRCPPGSMPPTDGQFLSTDDCIVCPVGMTSGGGLELCTACADGLHAPEEGMSKCVKKTNYWWMWVLLAGLVIAHLCAGAWLWYQNYKLASHVNAICKAQKEDLDSPLTKAIQLLDDISQGKTLNRKLLRERAEVIKATLLNSNNILTPDLNKQVDDSKFSKDIKQFLLQSAGTVERQKKLSASLGLSVFEIDEDRADFRDMLTNDSVLYGAMQSVGTTFDLDVLSAELHCPGRILTTSAMALLHKFGILHDLGISMQKMLSFVAAIEAGYKGLSFAAISPALVSCALRWPSSQVWMPC